MFTVFEIDTDWLALRHAASPITVIVRVWGEGQFEPMYGVKPDERGQWVRTELPHCFALNSDARAAIKDYLNA